MHARSKTGGHLAEKALPPLGAAQPGVATEKELGEGGVPMRDPSRQTPAQKFGGRLHGAPPLVDPSPQITKVWQREPNPNPPPTVRL